MQELSSKFLFVLVAIYGVLCIALAFNPFDRSVWFVENLTVWIILGVILVLYARGIRFSKTAYALMFVLIYLHTIGGHYTFARVPFDFVSDFFVAYFYFNYLASFTPDQRRADGRVV